ncbi:serine hydrolase domain-containing protein [Paucibacter soli]|uniref:serine hydrolase domain-containing protein n=1 Tax=Paucibacter soli TaxID=3133433 RepID=UPI0030B72DBF
MAASSTSARSTSTVDERRRLSLAVLAMLALPGRGHADEPESADARIAQLARELPEWMAELGVPGASLVLLREARVCWAAHLGVLQHGEARPVRADTVFEAASMSKPVLAYLALRQVQAGRLDLDRPVLDYSDERFEPPQPAQARITARMLLSHSSGLPNWRPGDADDDDGDSGPLQLDFEPGARFQYSGEGYFYLQRVLERISGLPLQALAARELFEPLGMGLSSFVLTPALERLRARGHDEAGRPLPPSHYRRANAGYTLYTTAGDYARFIGSLLEAKASAAMLAPQIEAGDRQPLARPARARGERVFWSLGWAIERGAQGPIAYHSGTNSTGFRCFSQFAPTRGSGLVLMSNSLAGNKLWQRLLALLGDL